MMQRIIAIMSRMADASASAPTLRRMAAQAAQAFVEQFPGSAVIFFERDVRAETVRAVVGVNIPSAWNMRAVRIAEIPLIAEALRRPRQVARGGVVRGVRPDVPAAATSAQPDEVLCAALPDSTAEPLHLLMVITPALPGEARLRELAVETVRHLLGTGACLAAGDSARAQTLSAIHHAKVEWQNVIDALPDIVGLVDRRRRIVRISRALERWSLGDVRFALGSDLHAALHPNCGGAACALATAIDSAWRELETRESSTFEVPDAVLGRDLAVELLVAVEPAAGNAATPIPRVAFIVSDVTLLRQAQRELTDLNRTLEKRVADRTEQLTNANGALRAEVARRHEVERSLRASQDELQALSERLMNAQEEERKRIAQDLHDSVGQSLSAIKYSVERARALLPREELELAEDVLGTAVEWVKRVIDDVRCISMNLRPAQLDHLGAASAVQWLCRQWRDVYQNVEVGTDIAVSDSDIPQSLSISVFRAVQESLNNVARHSGAQRVQVSIRLDEGRLKVVVQDDGTGFSASSDAPVRNGSPGPRGLRGLRERAERTGGSCDIASAPGRGTRVQLEWPLAAGLAAREANAWLN